MRIVLIDGNLDTLDGLSWSLIKREREVYSFACFSKAIAAMEAAHIHPNLIIVDCYTQRMSALEFLQQKAKWDCPTILLSAPIKFLNANLRLNAIVVPKPVDSDAFAKLVEHTLHHT